MNDNRKFEDPHLTAKKEELYTIIHIVRAIISAKKMSFAFDNTNEKDEKKIIKSFKKGSNVLVSAFLIRRKR